MPTIKGHLTYNGKRIHPVLKDGDKTVFFRRKGDPAVLHLDLSNLRRRFGEPPKRQGVFTTPLKISLLYGLSNLTDLESLDLSNNRFKEISNLENLTSLFTLNLSHNHIEQLKGLDGLINLQTLNLKYNDIKEITGLERLEKLQSLDLSNNKIETLNIYDPLPKLQSLDLGSNKIHSININDNLPNLRSLNLSYNSIEDINGLESMRNLQSLNLTHNKFTEVKGLDELVNLKSLKLNLNRITKISGLDNLKNLKFLDFEGSLIEEISGLDNLINLEVLGLSRTKITKLQGLRSLINLKKLYVNETSITDIEGIETLSKLENIYAGNILLTEEALKMSRSPMGTILQYCRKKAPVEVFICHYDSDYEKYNLIQFINFLNKKEEIFQVYYSIQPKATDIIPKCQIFLFLATGSSLNSEVCKNEIKLSNRNLIKIIPILGSDISWSDDRLKNLELESEFGLNISDYTNDLQGLSDKIYEYICQYKKEHDVFAKNNEKLFKLDLSELGNIITTEIDSVEFRDFISSNFDKYFHKTKSVKGDRAEFIKFFSELFQEYHESVRNSI